MTTVGVVGLGAMGRQIAGRLLSEGIRVYGTTRTRAKAAALIEQGLLWRDSPREVAEAADVVFRMVTDSDALEAVIEGPDGILAGLAAGKVYIDMSVVSPQTSRELAEQVEARGAAMLAAPVSGTVPAKAEDSLALIIGGDADAFKRVEPILRKLATTFTFVGDSGQALLLKLATNVSFAVQNLAFREGVLLAERGGIERDLAIDVLTRGATDWPMLQRRAALDLPDEAWFDVLELLLAARVLGYEHRDIADLFQVFSEMAAARAAGNRGSKAA